MDFGFCSFILILMRDPGRKRRYKMGKACYIEVVSLNSTTVIIKLLTPSNSSRFWNLVHYCVCQWWVLCYFFQSQFAFVCFLDLFYLLVVSFCEGNRAINILFRVNKCTTASGYSRETELIVYVCQACTFTGSWLLDYEDFQAQNMQVRVAGWRPKEELMLQLEQKAFWMQNSL